MWILWFLTKCGVAWWTPVGRMAPFWFSSCVSVCGGVIRRLFLVKVFLFVFWRFSFVRLCGRLVGVWDYWVCLWVAPCCYCCCWCFLLYVWIRVFVMWDHQWWLLLRCLLFVSKLSGCWCNSMAFFALLLLHGWTEFFIGPCIAYFWCGGGSSPSFASFSAAAENVAKHELL